MLTALCANELPLDAAHLSLLLICKVNGTDGYRYLRSLFIALPKAMTVDDHAALLHWCLALDAA